MGTHRLLGIGVGIVVASLAPAASAAVRYASPTGSGPNCSASSPCSIYNAVDHSGGNPNPAQNGDEIVVEPGDYGSSGSGLTTGLYTNGLSLTIHGVPGQPRPRLFFNFGYGIALNASVTLRYLEVSDSAASSSVIELVGNDTLDQVSVVGSGSSARACSVSGTGNLLRDSACDGSGPSTDGADVQASTSDAGLTARNVTFYGGGYGLHLLAYNGGHATTTATNAIIHGSPFDARADDDAFPGSASAATLDHSNYATAGISSGFDSITSPGSGSNQTTAPLLVDPAHGDFHEQPSSPTVDAGANDPSNGIQDLDGLPRTIHNTTDIGAFELPLAPSVTTGSATQVNTSSVTIGGSVNPNGLDTTVVVQYGTTTAYGRQFGSVIVLASGTSQPVSLGFGGLAAGTTYHYRLSGTNARGTSYGSDMTFTTASSPPPPPPPAPVVSLLKITPTLFVAASSGPTVAGPKQKTGTVIAYADTQAATATLSVIRLLPGVQRGRACVKPPRHPAKHGHPKRCTRHIPVGNFTHADRLGGNQVRFSGRLNGRALPPGPYQLQVWATNATGQTSTTISAGFRVRKPPMRRR